MLVDAGIVLMQPFMVSPVDIPTLHCDKVTRSGVTLSHDRSQ